MITLDIPTLSQHWSPPGGALLGGLRFFLSVDEWLVDVPGLEWMTEAGDGVSLELDGNPVQATQWLLTPHGWSAVLVGSADLDDSLEWLERFAQVFGRTAGALRGGPPAGRTPVRDPSFAATSVLYLTTADLNTYDPGYLAAQWAVDGDVTRQVTQAAYYWARQVKGRTHLRRDLKWWVECLGEEIPTPFAEAIEWDLGLRLENRRPSPNRVRRVDVRRQGELAVQVQDPTMNPGEAFELVARSLRWLPSACNYGYVSWHEGGYTEASGWSWPHVGEAEVRYNRPLLDRFVPDAQPIQLLTSAHLERAHDLSDWTIETVAPDRHIVSARDLEPWLVLPTLLPDYSGHHELDADLTATARRDFGDMILTREAIASHPWRRP